MKWFSFSLLGLTWIYFIWKKNNWGIHSGFHLFPILWLPVCDCFYQQGVFFRDNRKLDLIFFNPVSQSFLFTDELNLFLCKVISKLCLLNLIICWLFVVWFFSAILILGEVLICWAAHDELFLSSPLFGHLSLKRYVSCVLVFKPFLLTPPLTVLLSASSEEIHW